MPSEAHWSAATDDPIPADLAGARGDARLATGAATPDTARNRPIREVFTVLCLVIALTAIFCYTLFLKAF